MQNEEKNEPEYVFCYWDEYKPSVDKDDSSSIQKKQNSEEDVHDSVRERTNTRQDNQCKSKKAPDSE